MGCCLNGNQKQTTHGFPHESLMWLQSHLLLELQCGVAIRHC